MSAVEVSLTPRHAADAEVSALAVLWHDGWHDAHAALLPEALTRLRTPESFAVRLSALLADVRVIGPPEHPLGLCITKTDELYQLYVAPESRGTGVAAALLAEAERVMAQRGVAVAWLSCAIGNRRAARFYEKHGWRLARTMAYASETSAGPYLVDVWRFEKPLV